MKGIGKGIAPKKATQPQAKKGKANEIDKFVGAAIRTARIGNGKSQEWVAAKLGITFQQVQKYERGSNRVSCGRIVQIAAALGYPLEYFFPAPGSYPVTVIHHQDRRIADLERRLREAVTALTGRDYRGKL